MGTHVVRFLAHCCSRLSNLVAADSGRGLYFNWPTKMIQTLETGPLYGKVLAFEIFTLFYDKSSVRH